MPNQRLVPRFKMPNAMQENWFKMPNAMWCAGKTGHENWSKRLISVSCLCLKMPNLSAKLKIHNLRARSTGGKGSKLPSK